MDGWMHACMDVEYRDEALIDWHVDQPIRFGETMSTGVLLAFCCFSRSDNQNGCWICYDLILNSYTESLLTRRMNKHQFLSNQQTCSWFQCVCGNQCEWLVRQSLLYKENKPNLNRQQHHPLCTRFFLFLLPPPSALPLLLLLLRKSGEVSETQSGSKDFCLLTVRPHPVLFFVGEEAAVAVIAG